MNSDVTVLRPAPVDLHLHSRASDGAEAPGAVAERCAAAGIRVAALTDHNTLAGVAAFRAAAAGRFDVVTGCELTTRWNGADAHCLAYWTSETDPTFAAAVARVHDSGLQWWQQWVRRAGELGVPIDWAVVDRRLGAGRVAAPREYVRLMLDVAADDPRFQRYDPADLDPFVADWCAPGRPLHLDEPWWPELPEAIGWIVAAGGVAVLAHPARQLARRTDPATDLRELAAVGLAGVETWTTWHDPAEAATVAALCESTGLVPTAGSDYHGVEVKPWAPEPGALPGAPPGLMTSLERLYAQIRR
jgi:predicted metal-dependent phosphoesterase TrpH